MHAGTNLTLRVQEWRLSGYREALEEKLPVDINPEECLGEGKAPRGGEKLPETCFNGSVGRKMAKDWGGGLG